MTKSGRLDERISHRRLIVTFSAAVSAILTLLITGSLVLAEDPSPVNPPGPLPQFMVDDDGNRYEVFLPEEGGSILGDRFSFVADPGDVPSATFVGIRMTEGDAASNLGMTHHRYTVAGNSYIVDALDEFGRPPVRRFVFRNPAEACLPMPKMFSADVVDIRLVATDDSGVSQTVLNSGVKVFDGKLKVCGYVGSVPIVLSAGLEGAPGPAPATPEVSPTLGAGLPATGGSYPGIAWIALMLVVGSVLVVAGWLACNRGGRWDTGLV